MLFQNHRRKFNTSLNCGWQGLAMKTTIFFPHYLILSSFLFLSAAKKKKEKENSWISKYIYMSKLSCCATLLLYIFASHLLSALWQFFVEEPYVSEPSLKHSTYFWTLRYQLSHLTWAKETWALMVRVAVNIKKLTVYDLWNETNKTFPSLIIIPNM